MSAPVAEVTLETQRDIRPSTQLCFGPGYYKNVRINDKIAVPLIAWSSNACLSYKLGFIEADGQVKLRWDPLKQEMGVEESAVTTVINSYSKPGPEPQPEPEQVKKKISVPKKKKKVVSTKKNAIPEAVPKFLKEKKKKAKAVNAKKAGI